MMRTAWWERLDEDGLMRTTWWWERFDDEDGLMMRTAWWWERLDDENDLMMRTAWWWRRLSDEDDLLVRWMRTIYLSTLNWADKEFFLTFLFIASLGQAWQNPSNTNPRIGLRALISPTRSDINPRVGFELLSETQFYGQARWSDIMISWDDEMSWWNSESKTNRRTFLPRKNLFDQMIWSFDLINWILFHYIIIQFFMHERFDHESHLLIWDDSYRRFFINLLISHRVVLRSFNRDDLF
jgi:hypothetical protein